MSANWWDGLKVIVCSGSGGVGKTTMAASLALKIAESGKKALVLTIDPAKRLADAIGVQRANEVQKVPGISSGELYAEMIEARSVFIDFVRRSAPNPEVAEKLIRNRLFNELTTTLSGSQEFTALETLLRSVESGKYDVVILDTPPSQNAIDFLRAPERIFALFQDSITRWFVDSDRGGLLRNLMSRGTHVVISALETVTGPGFLSELSDFFVAAGAIQKSVAGRAIAVHRLLADKQTAFVVVTAFDEAKIKEATYFASDLSRSGHQLRAIIVNRSSPDWLRSDPPSDASRELVEYFQSLKTFYFDREQRHTQTLQSLISQAIILRLPEEKHSIEGIEGLRRMGVHL